MRMQSVMRYCSVAIIAVFLAGCEEMRNGASTSGTTAYSSSFSPTIAVTSDGSPTTLYWTYRVNGGSPMTTTSEGLTMIMQCSDLQLSINPETLKRIVEFSATVSGGASGSISAYSSEDLIASAGRTLINHQDLRMDMNLSAQGQTISGYMRIITSPTSPLEWFLDREDLDTLGVGYVFDGGNPTASVSVTLDMTFSAPGYGSQPIYETMTEPAQYHESWRITGVQDSITVAGKTYYNVVVVERTTLVPDASLSVESAQPTTITYWVAKGVGMVKGVGQYSIMGQQMIIELIGTNLSQS